MKQKPSNTRDYSSDLVVNSTPGGTFSEDDIAAYIAEFIGTFFFQAGFVRIIGLCVTQILLDIRGGQLARSFQRLGTVSPDLLHCGYIRSECITSERV